MNKYTSHLTLLLRDLSPVSLLRCFVFGLLLTGVLMSFVESFDPNSKAATARSNALFLGLRSKATTSSSDEVTNTHTYTAADLQPRYTGPNESDLTREQAEIRNAILVSRPRTGLSGPFGPWLAVPAIAQPAQELGRACRYGTSLSFAESELVILLTGAKAKSHAEFDIHVGEALKAGLSMELIHAIPRDENFSTQAIESSVLPLLKNEERLQAIASFAAELLHTSTVSDTMYATTKDVLGGDAVLVEITSIVGYYTYVAYTLNVFQIPSSSK